MEGGSVQRRESSKGIEPTKAERDWVMLPVSFKATLEFDNLSNRVVFPWSMCPRIETTQGREKEGEGSSDQ